jgi:hypothetical protein
MAADDAESELALTPAEAADWLHQQLGGRKRKSAAIRKLMRTGLGGVVLGSFRYGRELRTTRAELKRFVQEIRTATEGRRSRVQHLDRTGGTRRPPVADPAAEIAAARSTFRLASGTRPEAPQDAAAQIHLFSSGE